MAQPQKHKHKRFDILAGTVAVSTMSISTIAIILALVLAVNTVDNANLQVNIINALDKIVTVLIGSLSAMIGLHYNQKSSDKSTDKSSEKNEDDSDNS